MQSRKKILSLLFALLLVAPLAAGAQGSGDQGSGYGAASDTAAPVMQAAPAPPLTNLLPDKLAGVSATGAASQYGQDKLAELVADRAVIYQEYLVVSAVARQYADTRVEIFQTRNPFAALGLFSYNTDGIQSAQSKKEIGSGSAWTANGLVFWKDNYFVRVTDAAQRPQRAASPLRIKMAEAIAGAIVSTHPANARPPLLKSLPRAADAASSARYILGPESLNTYVERGREMFGFAGDAEAVMAEYKQIGQAQNNAPVDSDAASESASGTINPSTSDTTLQSPLKLVIVEYHTPQFAYDAMARLKSYIAALPEAERNRIIIKRQGNYVVEASNVEDLQSAEQLVDSIEYPYTVKWLRDPLLPTNDPFRNQKAAQMLLSTFGILGLMIMTALVVGAVFGTTVFLRRRRRLQEIFSDAGSMLRLDLDPFETTVLGLPPKRSED